MDARIGLLLDNLDRAFDKKSWHGTTLRGSLRGLDVKTALWRPAKDRRNVWEYLLHAAYWKYIVRRKLSGDKAAKFDRSPSNFPAIPEPPTKAALKQDIDFLVAEHALLREQVAGFPASKLNKAAGEFTFAALMHGVAAHDLYHAGQIQLVKRLHSGKR